MRTLFLLMGLCLSLAGHGQHQLIDSLKKEALRLPDDTNKVNVLNQLCDEIMSLSEYYPALDYGKKALSLSLQLEFIPGQETANRLMGRIQKKLGNYPESMKCFLNNLKMAETRGDKKAMAGAYNNIGTVYLEQKQEEQALQYMNKALALFKEIDDKKWIHNTYTNIGNIYTDLGRLDEAMTNYQTALRIRQALKDQKGISASYNNIGLVYQQQGDYNKAIENMQLALELAMAAKYKGGMANAYYNIAMSKLAKHQLKEVKPLIEKSMALCQEMNNPDGIKECYFGLAAADSAQGNFQQALANYKQYIVYKDSLVNEENTKKIMQQQLQYEFDKKELELKMAQARKEEAAKRNRILLFSGIGVLFLFIGFAFYHSRQQQMAQRKLELEQTKRTISRDLHDEIGSTLSSISMQAELAHRKMARHENVSDLVDTISTASKDMLTQMSDIVWSLNADHENIEQLSIRLLNFCATVLPHHQIEFSCELDEATKRVTLNTEQLKEVYLICKEAITNSMKYAACTNILLTFKSDARFLTVQIADNGKGFEEGQLSNVMGGRGIQHMKSRAAKLKAQLEMQSTPGQGAKVRFELPLT